MKREHEELGLIKHWEATLDDLLDRTSKFPKTIRFTVAQRIDNAGLDILEWLVEARFLPRGKKGRLLAAIDARLHRLRYLLRAAHRRRHLSNAGYEHLMRQVDEAGRMVGGWRRQQAA